jgi:hypothetical protein
MAKCEYVKCGKKLPKAKPGPGKPRRFCNGKCSMSQWRLDHPYKRVYQDA